MSCRPPWRSEWSKTPPCSPPLREPTLHMMQFPGVLMVGVRVCGVWGEGGSAVGGGGVVGPVGDGHWTGSYDRTTRPVSQPVSRRVAPGSPVVRIWRGEGKEEGGGNIRSAPLRTMHLQAITCQRTEGILVLLPVPDVSPLLWLLVRSEWE